MRRHVLVTTLLTGLILYGGLYPFAGWTTGNAIGFLTERSPHSSFEDLFINVIVFMPLGFTAALALNHRYRFDRGIALAVAHGFFLSFTIEAFQAFLPMRYSSLTDLVMNTFGTLVGALVAIAFRSSRLRSFGGAWFEPAPLSRLAFVALVAWGATLIMPFAFVADPVQVVARLCALVSAPDAARPWRMGMMVLSALAILGLGQMLASLAKEDVRLRFRITLLLMLPVAAGVIVREQGMATEELLGAAVAAAVTLTIATRRSTTHAVIALSALSAYLVLSEILPGSGGTYRAFNWIPFGLHLRNPLLGVTDLFNFIWPAAALTTCVMILAPRSSAYVMIAISVGAGLCLLGLELLQVRLPGRYGDVTAAFVMGLACALSFVSVRYALMRHDHDLVRQRET